MDLEILRFTGNRPLARLVSEDDGQTWRVAVQDDEDRDDLIWDALFAPPGPGASPRIQSMS